MGFKREVIRSLDQHDPVTEADLKVNERIIQNIQDNYFEVDIYLTKHERKKGVASKALNLAINKVNFYSFRAIIKKSNRRSYNFF